MQMRNALAVMYSRPRHPNIFSYPHVKNGAALNEVNPHIKFPALLSNIIIFIRKNNIYCPLLID